MGPRRGAPASPPSGERSPRLELAFPRKHDEAWAVAERWRVWGGTYIRPNRAGTPLRAVLDIRRPRLLVVDNWEYALVNDDVRDVLTDLHASRSVTRLKLDALTLDLDGELDVAALQISLRVRREVLLPSADTFH